MALKRFSSSSFFSFSLLIIIPPLLYTHLSPPVEVYCFTIVAFVSVAAGTCLSCRCIETALVYLLISRLPRNGSGIFAYLAVVCIVTALHATLLNCTVSPVRG
jgi:hypothetical protein